MKFNIASPQELSFELISKSIGQLRTVNLAEYLSKRKMMIDFYEGFQNSSDYLKKFGFQDMEMPLQTLNITKKIIDKISLLYKYPPDRQLIVKGQEQENDPYNEWIDNNKWFNMWRKQVERYKKLLGVVVSMPLFTTNGWRPYLFTQYIPYFMSSDPFNPIAYSFPLAVDHNDLQGKTEQEWLFISDQYWFIHDETGRNFKEDKSFTAAAGMMNPFKKMPVIEERSQWPIVTQYWPEGASDLVDVNQSVNIGLNDINSMIHYQAFSEIVARGAAKEDMENMKRGPHKILGTPTEGDIHSLQHSPLITESMSSLRTMIENIAWSYNLSVSWSQEGDPASGFSLIVRNMELLEARENDEDSALMSEQKIYDIIRMQGEIIDGLDLKLPEATIRCNFEDGLRLPVNEKETIEVWRAKIDANVKSYVDWIQSEEGVEEKEALEIYQRNKKLNKNFTAAQESLINIANQEGIEVESETDTGEQE